MSKKKKEEVQEKETMTKETVKIIKTVISELNAFDWDVESCRKLCLVKKRDDEPAAAE